MRADFTHSFSPEEVDEALSFFAKLRELPPRAFAWERALDQYVRGLPERATTSTVGWNFELWFEDWAKRDGALVTGLLSRRELSFWFRALTLPERLTDCREEAASAAALREEQIPEVLEAAEATARLRRFFAAADRHRRHWPKEVLAPLARLLREAMGATDALDVLLDTLPLSALPQYLHYLGPPEGRESYPRIEEILTAQDGADALFAADLAGIVELVAWSGDDAQIERVVALAKRHGAPDLAERAAMRHSGPSFYVGYLVSHRVPLTAPRLIRGLVQSKGRESERLMRRIVATRDAELQRELVAVAARAHAPGMVGGMLDLLERPAAKLAHGWLTAANPVVVEELVRLAAGRSRRKDVAARMLRETSPQALSEVVSELSPERATWLREHVLAHAEPPRPELEASKVPPWLRALGRRPATALPDFVARDALPELTTESEHRLPRALTAGITAALSEVEFGFHPHGGPRDRFDASLTSLRELLDPSSAGRFSAELTQRWLAAGASPAHRWCLFSNAFLFDEHTPRRMLELLARHRSWFEDEELADHVFDVLRVMATPQAVAALAEIETTHRRGWFRELARDVLEHMAADAGQTLARFVDERLAKLPPDHSGEAVRLVWTRRLEQAMCEGRVWPGDFFFNVLLRHEVVRELATRLVWKICDEELLAVETFRLDPGGATASAQDTALDLDDAAWIGLAHPAELSPEDVATWSELFADYEIVQPFAQLSRPAFRHGQMNVPGYRSPTGRTLEVAPLVAAAEAIGWSPCPDGPYRFEGLQRRFEHFATVALLRFERPVSRMISGQTATRSVRMEQLSFTTSAGEALDEAFVHPTVFSESHADVQTLLDRAS